MMGNNYFHNKKIIVYGASSGVGRQVTQQLCDLGARVVLVGRNEERLREAASRFAPGDAMIQIRDLSSFKQAQDSVISAVKWDGDKLDGCVFSVGIYAMHPIGIATEEALHKMFSTNFYSMVGIMKAFSSRRVSNDGASFVGISSRAAMMPDKAQGIYGATKAAINAYIAASAKELSARKIRVNVVCPENIVDTPMGKGLTENMSAEQVKLIYPLGVLTAEDVANTALFLLGDGSKKITGQAIWLSAGNDGGSIDGHKF